MKQPVKNNLSKKKFLKITKLKEIIWE